MTPRQYKALQFIRGFIASNGLAPTLQQIADHLGIKSKTGAHAAVDGLSRLGFIHRASGGYRNIVLTAAAAAPALAAFSTEALRAEIARRRTAHG